MRPIVRLQAEALRLSQLVNPGAVPVRLRIDYDHGPPLILPIAGAVVAPEGAASGPAPSRPIGPAERAILDALQRAERPLKREALAHAAGLSVGGSHFRHAFSRLRRQRLIYRPEPDVAAYWPTGRPVPGSGP
jgi:hypothetical protein